MRETIIANLRKRFDFYADLVGQIDEETVSATLEVPRHRSVGLHLWCIVGTRESFAKAIAAGEMGGWTSSVTQLERNEFKAKLATSSQALLDAIASVQEWTPERDQLLAQIAEHEVMHEGQIIRLMFGLDKPVPASCAWAVCG